MADIEKAEELLKKIISGCDEVRKDHPFPDEPLIYNRPCHRCVAKDECFVIEAIQALSAEFTKDVRAMVKYTPLTKESALDLVIQFRDKLKEACDLLDAQQQRIEELEKQKTIIPAFIKGVKDEAYDKLLAKRDEAIKYLYHCAVSGEDLPLTRKVVNETTRHILGDKDFEELTKGE